MILITLINTISFATEDLNHGSKDVSVMVKQIINVDPNLLDEKVLQTYKETGWTITKKNLIRLVPLETGKILVDNKVLDVEEGITRVKQNSKYAYFTEEKEDLAKKIKLNPNNNSETIIFEVDMFNVIDKMDKIEIMASMEEYENISPLSTKVTTKPYGSKYYVGDDVHCNRFNGPNTDHIHYDKLKNPLKTATNFAGSDCDVAVSRSNLCIFSNHCNKTGIAADCSRLVGSSTTNIRCSRKYHTHSYNARPSYLGR